MFRCSRNNSHKVDVAAENKHKLQRLRVLADLNECLLNNSTMIQDEFHRNILVQRNTFVNAIIRKMERKLEEAVEFNNVISAHMESCQVYEVRFKDEFCTCLTIF